MKRISLFLTLISIFTLAITACQGAPTAVAPLEQEDLQTLVAGTLTAAAVEMGQTMTAGVTITATLAPTMTETATLPPTETPTREVVSVTLSGNTTCRKGASTYFPVITTIPAGSVVEVLARNPALDAVHAIDASYAPVVNRTIIWTPTYSHWPTLSDPVGNHTMMPYLSQTTFAWSDRASLDVPLPMQDTNLLTNLKYKAIQAHASEFDKYDGFLKTWAHKDEIFWPENPFGSNQPPVAEAGPDVFSQPGAYAQLDGSASRDPEGSTLGYHWVQRSGSAVALQNAASAMPGFAIPANASLDDTWAFQLVVSDGWYYIMIDVERMAVAWKRLIDANDVVLGNVVSAARNNVTFVTTAGYMTTINWNGTFSPAQIYYTGATCTGSAYLNSGSSTNVGYMYGKFLVWSGSLGQFMIATPGSIKADGTAETVKPSVAGFTITAIDNPTCGPSSSDQYMWPLTATTTTAVGLPAAIVPPLRMQ